MFLDRFVPSFSSDSTSIVTFTLRGNLFHAKKSLFDSYPKHFLHVLVNGSFKEANEDNSKPIEIDFEDKYFQIVLDYYEKGLNCVENLDANTDLEAVVTTLDFFGIEELQEQIDKCTACNKTFLFSKASGCTPLSSHEGPKFVSFKKNNPLHPYNLGIFQRFLNKPVTMNDIESAELRLGVTFSLDLKEVLLQFRGFHFPSKVEDDGFVDWNTFNEDPNSGQSYGCAFFFLNHVSEWCLSTPADEGIDDENTEPIIVVGSWSTPGPESGNWNFIELKSWDFKQYDAYAAEYFSQESSINIVEWITKTGMISESRFLYSFEDRFEDSYSDEEDDAEMCRLRDLFEENRRNLSSKLSKPNN